MNKHEFAVFYPALNQLKKGCEYHIKEVDAVHRIARVLRLTKGDQFILFERGVRAKVSILDVQKKVVTIQLKSIETINPFEPSITFLLPLLKRDAFEAALYFLTEVGVNHIYPIITAKTNRSWGGPKEQARLNRIIIAAAEQSKNVAFPQLYEPISFDESLTKLSNQNIFFHPTGHPINEMFSAIQKDSFTLIIGPEGDLTEPEQKQLKKHDVMSYRLSPTILRAQEAAGVVACMIRSFFYQ